LKIETTKKLFYNKWLFKIELTEPGICYLKRLSLEDIKNMSVRNFANRLHNRAVDNKENILKIAFFLEDAKLEHDFVTRAEGDTLNIYTNDTSLLEKVQLRFPKKFLRLWQPKSIVEQSFLEKNNNVIICKKLPNQGFRFKSYISSLEKISRNTTDQFLKWTENYSDSIIIPRATKELFTGSYRGYCFNNYLYVKDPKTLMMVTMYLGNAISRTEQYVLDTEIV
jgi:hypothetical protein